MYLEDSIEYDYTVNSDVAEAVPLLSDIHLSDIWIPSQLLVNRQSLTNPNLNKPAIFRTLEKPVLTDCFSVYSDPNLQNKGPENCCSPAEGILDEFSHADILDLLNDYPPATKSDGIIITSDSENSSTTYDDLFSSNQFQNCVVPSEHLPVSNLCERKNTFGSPEDESTDDEENSYSLKNKKVFHQSDTNPISTVKGVTEILKDSLEEFYYSEDEENNKVNSFSIPVETSDCNFANPCTISDCSSSDIVTQFDSIGIEDKQDAEEREMEAEESNNGEYNCHKVVAESLAYVENSELCEPVETSDCNFANPCTISDCSSSDIVTQFDSIGIEDKQNAEEREMEAEESNNGEYKCHKVVAESLACVENSELCEHFDGKLDNDLETAKAMGPSTEALIEYPIAYQRPAIQETGGKQNNQKGKKKKKTRKKNIQLDVFSGKDDCCNEYEEPLVDEFYENIMRQKLHKSYASEYPSLSKKSQINFMEASKITSPLKEPKPEISFKTVTNYLYDKCIPSSSNGTEIIEEKIVIETSKKEQNTVTIVIENLPLDATEEQIKSIVTNYGELKEFSLEPCGKFWKASLQMDFTCDVDWMIGCLNGNMPFGATSNELKCYKLL